MSKGVPPKVKRSTLIGTKNVKKHVKIQAKQDTWTKRIETLVKEKEQKAKQAAKHPLAFLDDLQEKLEEIPVGEKTNKNTPANNPHLRRVVSQRGRQITLQKERQQFLAVLKNPVFKSNPLGTIETHLTNVMEHVMADEARKEAAAYIREAENHLKSSSGFFGLFTSGPNYFDAVDCYNRAGNVLKSAKLWTEAGDAYVKAAETEIKSGEVDASVMKFVNAASCYKKSEPKKAVNCLIRANETAIKNGRFHMAARHEKEVAEIYEQQLDQPEEAIKYYLSAADRFSLDDSTAIAQGCSVQAASLAAKIGKYEQAAKLFEENAESCVTDSLRRYSVKDYLLRAGLCRLCLDDVVGAKKAFERYCQIDSTFASTKEYPFLTDIAAALEDGDVDAYTELVTKWDRTNAMDDWKTDILLKIKRMIDEEPSLT